MKMSIEWHESNVINMKSYMVRLEREKESVEFKIRDLERSIYSLELKIERAKKEGKKQFDSEKYLGRHSS